MSFKVTLAIQVEVLESILLVVSFFVVTMVIYKHWQPRQATTPRATAIPEQTWTLYKDRISAWHQGKGFTQRQIILLLEESGLVVTYGNLSSLDRCAKFASGRINCTGR